MYRVECNHQVYMNCFKNRYYCNRYEVEKCEDFYIFNIQHSNVKAAKEDPIKKPSKDSIEKYKHMKRWPNEP